MNTLPLHLCAPDTEISIPAIIRCQDTASTVFGQPSPALLLEERYMAPPPVEVFDENQFQLRRSLLNRLIRWARHR